MALLGSPGFQMLIARAIFSTWTFSKLLSAGFFGPSGGLGAPFGFLAIQKLSAPTALRCWSLPSTYLVASLDPWACPEGVVRDPQSFNNYVQ